MPIITMNILEGQPLEKKRKMVQEVTRVISESLDVDPKTIRIMIYDLKYDNLSVAGELMCDKK